VTLRVYIEVADPSARRRMREVLSRDRGVVIVTHREEADVVVSDAAALRPVAAPPMTEAGTALTGRELEVLRLVANGLGNKEIGAVLGISAHTAKSHVAAVLAKLDARSRTEAVTIGLREGLLPL
jgi:DNA-binding CsgD family transcriptional regulator